MRKISKEELDTILENHKHWIKKDVEGWENMRADLSETNLRSAKLYGANLYGANLRGADLCGADLSVTNLSETNLRGADLRGVNLFDSNLRGANLIGSKLSGAILIGSDLYGAILPDQETMKFVCPLCCPEEGSFIGWKKAYVVTDLLGYCIKIPVIVKLLILNTAKRLSCTGRKCRCNEAEVLDIQSVEFGTSIAGLFQEAFSSHDVNFKYKIGKTVRVEDFDDNRWNECSTGIHFFITRQEAVNYYF
jgi:hypothetical protein